MQPFRHNVRFLYFMKSYVLFLNYSINLKVAHNEYQYKRYYLNCKSFGYKTCPVGIVMGYVFRKYFARFEGLGCISRPFLIFPPTRINQKPIIIGFGFFTLFKECTSAIKNTEYHLLKNTKKTQQKQQQKKQTVLCCYFIKIIHFELEIVVINDIIFLTKFHFNTTHDSKETLKTKTSDAL